MRNSWAVTHHLIQNLKILSQSTCVFNQFSSCQYLVGIFSMLAGQPRKYEYGDLPGITISL